MGNSVCRGLPSLSQLQLHGLQICWETNGAPSSNERVVGLGEQSKQTHSCLPCSLECGRLQLSGVLPASGTTDLWSSVNTCCKSLARGPPKLTCLRNESSTSKQDIPADCLCWLKVFEPFTRMDPLALPKTFSLAGAQPLCWRNCLDNSHTLHSLPSCLSLPLYLSCRGSSWSGLGAAKSLQTTTLY